MKVQRVLVVDKLLLGAIEKYTPLVDKVLLKKSEQFERRKQWIVHDATDTIAVFIKQQNSKALGRLFM